MTGALPTLSDAACRAVLDAHPQPIWARDAESGETILVNDAARALFGAGGEVPPDIEAMRRAAGGGERSEPVRLPRAGGDAVLEVTLRDALLDGRRVVLAIATNVGGRKRAERSLRQSAERDLAAVRHQTELILNAIADGVYVLDLEGRVVRQNPAAAAMLGWSDAEIVGRQGHALIHHHRPDGSPYPAAACPVHRTLSDGLPRHAEGEHLFTKDGRGFPVDLACAPLRDADGAITGAVASFRDITTRQRAERIRVAETEILQMISAGAPLAATLDATARAIEGLARDAMASILLLDADGVHIRHGAAPSLPAAYVAAIDGIPIGPRCGSCGTAMHRRERVIVTDIETDPLWADYRDIARPHGLRACWSTPVESADGTVIGSFALYYREPRAPTADDLALICRFEQMVAIAIERTRTAESLRDSERRLLAITQAATDVIWDWDLASDTIRWSDDFEQVFGHPPSAAASSEAWLALIHPEDRGRIRAGARAAIEQRLPFWEAEIRSLHADGTVRDIENRGRLLLDEDGTPLRIVGGVSDITARKRAQRDLRERIKELRCLYRVLELTSDQGRPAGDVCRDVAGVLPGSLLHEDVAVARVVLDGEESRSGGWAPPLERLGVPIGSGAVEIGFVEVGYRESRDQQEGGPGPFLAEKRAMLEAVAAHLGRMHDTRRMATKLMQSERLGAVGGLTGGIAHDFNNLLTVILGNAEILESALAADERLGPLAEMTRVAAERGADLTHHLLAFARRQALTPEATDVGALIEEMRALLLRTLGAHIDIDTVADADLPQALVDRSQLESAVLNLCINARDAMPDGGRLEITLSNARLDEAQARRDEEVAPGRYVCVAVSDTGTGMPPEVAARAVEPFFTTKETGKGSGLGLSMVYGFVKQSKGHIEIDSAPGRGTTVRLYLPRAEAGGTAAAAGAGAAEPAGGTERILLVEDDDMVRSHVARQLERLGYRVVSVDQAAAALAVLEHDRAFDLLFTDVVMPGGMNGRRLADAARALHPGLPVLLTSGYADDASPAALGDDAHILGKPYRRRDLAEAVRSALSGARRPQGRPR